MGRNTRDSVFDAPPRHGERLIDRVAVAVRVGHQNRPSHTPSKWEYATSSGASDVASSSRRQECRPTNRSVEVAFEVFPFAPIIVGVERQ